VAHGSFTRQLFAARPYTDSPEAPGQSDRVSREGEMIEDVRLGSLLDHRPACDQPDGRAHE